MEERGRGPNRSALIWRWVALAAYVALLYGSLPFGPRLGMRVLRTPLGGFILGPFLPFLTLGGAALLMLVLRRRHAPVWSYVVLAACAVAYAFAFSWLRAAHLERTHLPEYGIAALLAWRALAPLVPGTVAGYVAAAALGAAIGYGDELLQGVVPGRHYDIRDVTMNAIGSVLGVIVLAAIRGRRPPPAVEPGTLGRVTNEVSSRRAMHN
jgi:hypothetical protein